MPNLRQLLDGLEEAWVTFEKAILPDRICFLVDQNASWRNSYPQKL
jgi:hypothetical protein